MTLRTGCAAPLLALGLIATAALVHVGAQAGFPLVCRGGGALHFTYTPYSNLSPEPQIWIRFERAPVAAGAARENVGALAAGQCTWLDRAVSPSEPGTIVLAAPVLAVRQFSIQWQHGQVMGISSELGYLNALQRADGVQTFRVYNDGKGNFIVSAIE